jgi:hypothetical protein
MTYPYKQAKYDYGPRKGTIAIVLHMTEGNGDIGDVHYLMGNPARGVSANFVSLKDGTIYQMLPLFNASGSLNPLNRSTDKLHYGKRYLLEALPNDEWMDPNAYVISMEIGGKAVDGPTDIQTASIIAWIQDMMDMFPTLTGIFGHADQTDTKPCPGTSPNMLSIFAAMGHGDLIMAQAPITSETPMLIDFAAQSQIYDLNGTTKIVKTVNPATNYPSPYGTIGSKRAIYYTHAGVRSIGLIVPTAIRPVPPLDCSTEIADAITADRAKAKVVYE